MVPDPTKTSLGLEYFCNEGDDLWNMSDEDLISLAKREIVEIGITRAETIADGVVVRQHKAYPVYNSLYDNLLQVIKNWLTGLENFHTVGRNGLHKYNNQDHSMLTAILAVRNILQGEKHDVWEVNTERSYHEEVQLKPEVVRKDPPVDILAA